MSEPIPVIHVTEDGQPVLYIGGKLGVGSELKSFRLPIAAATPEAAASALKQLLDQIEALKTQQVTQQPKTHEDVLAFLARLEKKIDDVATAPKNAEIPAKSE